MRLCERTCVPIAIIERACAFGALGSHSEDFSGEQLYRGSILPLEGGFERDACGMEVHERIRVLIPGYACVQAGDAALVEGRLYRIYDVRRWSMHIELDCEVLP